MANTVLNLSAKPSWTARFADALGALFVRMGEHSAGAAAAREAARLSQMSDKELARLGVDRQNIVAHAFRDLTNR